MKHMHLVAYLYLSPTNHHHGMWRHPATHRNLFAVELYQQIGRVLEQGKFDMLFFPDVLCVYGGFQGGYEVGVKYGGQGSMSLDPVSVLAMVATATERLGLGATLSTTFYAPFYIARTLCTLDHLTKGRIAWNIVTSSTHAEAQNFGFERIPDRDKRYDRADEFLEVCLKLWDSWEEDAIVMDRETGVYADPSKVHAVDHAGTWLKVKGPLTLPRGPQGYPVLMQAGSSERGREFAARWGEVIFTLHHRVEEMKNFYRDVKSRMARYGREPEECAILPALQVIVGETEALAREKADFVNELVHPVVGLSTMSSHIGIDLSKYPLDEPIRQVYLEEGSRGSFDVILQGTQSENLSLGDAAKRFATSELTPQLVGTPAQVADAMEAMFREEACDGFVLTPCVLPGSFEDFVRLVVPELQRRGIFRKEYTGVTLRDHLGLSRPAPKSMVHS
ncbi:LLM class flavin-dependent oxidoreductase [Kyrpidia tusciae]|uniref:Dibenzothiophene desulfurization enzyme n=1 Tax=Kyrpidia tusciae (strain DSM 2912 / NBRC 15312 / T2) TaxID=562970 RepID=D5WWB9_KYRT2|nr:LLM class flavin-dependent oxidoreductase [Kyrpidia tusciae]ADG07684.1 dibenzothiophene desulfurization enzyme [Kyrpidia tusciae DSM 2912]